MLARPFFDRHWRRAIVNHSALARRIRPLVERALLKRVSDVAVMMALKRLAPRLARLPHAAPRGTGRFGELTVRSHLMEWTFHQSSTIRAKQRRLLARLRRAVRRSSPTRKACRK